MSDIVLRPDLLESLEKDAEREAKSVSEIVNEAVAHYLRERQRTKLSEEIAAYKALHQELKQKYLGQWVAVHEQKLVDHDPDGGALYQRMRAKYGRAAVLIRQVTEQITEEVWMRTPSTGKVGR